MNTPDVYPREDALDTRAGEAFRMKCVNGTATAADFRKELARRIRSFRAVSVANDPQRGYRRKMIECMRGRASYHRLAGIPKLPKFYIV
jgi:hypothetical protein